MYKIGEFSKITNLSVKTLHYYDEQKLLCPSSRNEKGYRIYDNEDFKKALTIKLFRSMDFSIAEIKDIMWNYKDEDLHYYLMEKKQQIINNIFKEESIIKRMDKYITKMKMEEIRVMNYEIKEVNIPKQLVAYISYQGSYSECGKYIGDIYKEAKNKVNGTCVHVCYDEDYQDDAKLDICVPISGNISANKTKQKELPEIKAISTIHIGPYSSLNLAYKALLDYAKDNNLEVYTPSRLVYHKGPGMLFKGNESKYETEVIIPVK